MADPRDTVNLFIETWKTFVRRLPAGSITHEGGLAAILGNVPLPFFNLVAHDGPLRDPADLRLKLGRAAGLAAGCPHPWMFALVDPWAPPGWEAVAAEAGLAPALPLYGMEADRLNPPRRPRPRLEYRRVADEMTARALSDINALAYGMPLETCACLHAPDFWRDPIRGFVGYLDGRAVTAAGTLPSLDTNYVAFVATLPDLHGRGLAEAVLRHAIEETRLATGLERTTLHATEAGRPLYEAMGYRTVARLTLLTKPHEA